MCDTCDTSRSSLENNAISTMIRIRDSLSYESRVMPKDVRWLDEMCVPPTISDMNRWLRETCQHNWIDDWIDVGAETTQKITYCTICEINR
jgi:hypothetical protein